MVIGRRMFLREVFVAWQRRRHQMGHTWAYTASTFPGSPLLLPHRYAARR
jgi:hypothetical protein